MNNQSNKADPDIVLVGAGIMSATLGAILKELQPDLKIEIFESLGIVSGESSDAWNNAGTGHAALCELNYTPERPDGSIDHAKALQINESFEISKQFWSYLVESRKLEDPDTFIHPIPHFSFVRGSTNVSFLKKRFKALCHHHFFSEMKYSEDHQELAEWFPLVMEGRPATEPVAATQMKKGTDVNYGVLTRQLVNYLMKQPGITLHLKHEVLDLKREKEGKWLVTVRDKNTQQKRTVRTTFVFLGAGGGALPLLQKSGIPEGKGFGGFPVSGQWLRCNRTDLIDRHHAKVYGKASIGAPPMSVPHLDTRVIEGKRGLLFGPFAGFTTKYLKNGSPLDFPLAIRPDNFVPMTAAALQNVDLTRYLIGQVLQSPRDRLKALQEYMPEAKMTDWELEIAGQRVQVIKKDAKKGGILYFGTEVIYAKDGSIAALLGASPGASTSVSIMIELLKDCFPSQMKSTGWQTKLKQMIPSFGQNLSQDEPFYRKMNQSVNETLELVEAAAE